MVVTGRLGSICHVEQVLVGFAAGVVHDELVPHWIVKALTILAHTGVGTAVTTVQLEVMGYPSFSR